MNSPQRIWRTLPLLLVFSLFIPLGTLAATKLQYISEEIIQERDSQKMWQVDRSRRFKQAEDVANYLQELNTGGEYTDWRLPEKKELYALHSIFDLKNNGEVKIRVEGKYWLTDGGAPPFVGSWEIGDQCGPSRTFYKGKAGYVRAVRP